MSLYGNSTSRADQAAFLSGSPQPGRDSGMAFFRMGFLYLAATQVMGILLRLVYLSRIPGYFSDPMRVAMMGFHILATIGFVAILLSLSRRDNRTLVLVLTITAGVALVALILSQAYWQLLVPMLREQGRSYAELSRFALPLNWILAISNNVGSAFDWILSGLSLVPMLDRLIPWRAVSVLYILNDAAVFVFYILALKKMKTLAAAPPPIPTGL